MEKKPDPEAPRWRLLLAMALGVLGAHLLLLAGGLPSWPTSPTAAGTDPPELAPAMQTRSIPAHEAAADTALAEPVTRSSVRWIAPQPGRPSAAKAPAGPSQPPVQPPPPPAAADPVPAGIPPVVDSAPPLADTTRPVEPAPSAPPAQDAVQPPVVDSVAPSPMPPAALEDTLVAAASSATPTRTAGSPSLQPANPPGSTNLRYEVTGNAKGLPYRADARLDWQVNGASYATELEISAFLMGSRVRTSTGRIGPNGLEPERFGDRRRSSEKATHFDRAGQRIRYSSNAPDTPLLPGAQDQLSMFLQLAALLQARPDAYPAGQSIRLQVASTGDAEVWQFLVGPEEALALPVGSVSARRLTRPPRHEHDNTVEIWLAPSLQFLPVRIRLSDRNGDFADQQLREMPVLAPLPNMPQ